MAVFVRNPCNKQGNFATKIENALSPIIVLFEGERMYHSCCAAAMIYGCSCKADMVLLDSPSSEAMAAFSNASNKERSSSREAAVGKTCFSRVVKNFLTFRGNSCHVLFGLSLSVTIMDLLFEFVFFFLEKRRGKALLLEDKLLVDKLVEAGIFVAFKVPCSKWQPQLYR